MNADDLLSFKEYSPTNDSYTSSGRAEININSPKRATDPYSDQHLEGLIEDMSSSVRVLDREDEVRQSSGDDSAPDKQLYSFFSIEYYQQFFNVDTSTVVERIVSSIVPRKAPPSYLKQHIGLNPDLYGPFWIVITLIFSIAISGNVASYIQYANDSHPWHYNFHLVSIAATTIIMYVCFVPLSLWAAFKWFVRPTDPDIETEGPYTPGLLTLICVYGYSLAIYIPVSILWVIPLSLLQWLLVITATFLSGSVLVLVLTPALRVSRVSLILAAVIVGAHFLLATGFMLYFFHVPESLSPSTVDSPVGENRTH
ncbi:Protein YIPF1 [Pseudolycoriella hygida]|uniref:Protein YIPF n=1 Tax=Pseudolycoriella hygida TaxID=35572 RepID=A0A9Q0NGU7_9DIPT|nr:Protein YIPF1 [Pseudolycoriella hygida]